ncbi:S-layer homology domain-containing protein [Paenibacillus whitsoniae]|nr:S-layer homology domain-containing protein [Paenibacillus whitsoniae]
MILKKKLSLPVIIALIFTMLASGNVYAADSAAPSTGTPTDASTANPAVPALDTQGKFNALKEKKIFEGTDDSGKEDFSQEVTRAQLAKVLVRLNGLDEDKAASAVYRDLGDAAWAAGFIGAATKAGLMEGVAEGTFAPAGIVTTEQLASVLARVFKLQAAESEVAKVTGTVSEWAKGYVAEAMSAGLMTSALDYTLPAKRELLVNTAYAAYQLIQAGGPPVTKVSVADFKATGAKTLVVKLNGVIADTSKLTVSILRGSITGAAVTGAQKWNTNKNEVTITLDTKMTEGIYTVKLDAVKDGGLSIDKGSAEVSVGNEKITQIDFTTPSDTIAQGMVKFTFKALNQYKEISDLSAAIFSIYTSPGLDFVPAGDSQSVVVDTVYGSQLRKDQPFEIRIVAPDYTVQANKTFTVGDLQTVGKVELSDVVYVNGKTKFEPGDTVTVPYKAFDQYGYAVIDLDVLKKNANTFTNAAGVIDTAAAYPPQGFGFIPDENGDGLPELKAKAVGNFNIYSVQDVQLSVTAFGSSQTATKVLKVAAPKTPFDISIGNFPNTVAVGDDDFYLPVVVKDQGGNLLSTDDVIENADKINVYGYGNGSISVGAKDAAGNFLGGIEKSGAYKGTIRISNLKTLTDQNKGQLTVKASVVTSGKTATATTNVVSKRYPRTVYLSAQMKPKMLPSLDMVNGRSENAFRLKFKDQYGEDFDRDYRGYAMKLTFAKTSGTVTDAVYVLRGATRLDRASSTFIVNGVDATVEGYDSGSSVSDFGYYRDRDFFFTAIPGDDNEGTYQVTAQLYKGDRTTVAAGTASLMSSAIATTQLIKGREANNLTYTLTPFANGIYAVDKIKDTLKGAETNTISTVSSSVTSSVYSTEGYSLENYFSGKVVLTAKDASGNVVQLPNNAIQSLASVTSANTRASAIVIKPKADGQTANFQDGYGIRGKEAGTTSISVIFKPSHYAGSKVAFLDKIDIKDDPLTVSSFTATYNGKAKVMALSQLKAGVTIFSGNSVDTAAKKLLLKQTFSNITLMDQYGNNAFKNSSIFRFAPVFGIQAFVSNVKWSSDNIVPGSGYIAIEFNGTGVNSLNGKTNAVTPVPAGVEPTDWVFASVPNADPAKDPAIQLKRGDAKYIYTPAISAVDGSPVEIASFTATVITANGKTISVDVYPDPSK